MTTYSPGFIRDKENELFEHFAAEVIELGGQSVIYYAISAEETDDDIYGESDDKVFLPGIEIPVLIQYDEPEVSTTELGPDKSYAIEVYFLRAKLVELDLRPMMGDFVNWNSIYFEITNNTEPQLVGGSPSWKHQVLCICKSSRLSQLPIKRPV